MKIKEAAKKMTGNPKGVMEKNNKTMMEIDKHIQSPKRNNRLVRNWR